MHRWIEITDPEGIPSSRGTLSYGAKVEYSYFAAVALISTGRAVWCGPPKPTKEIIIPVPPKETTEKPRVSKRDKEIQMALAKDNYNEMRKVLAAHSEQSTAGLKKPALRARLKALLD